MIAMFQEKILLVPNFRVQQERIPSLTNGRSKVGSCKSFPNTFSGHLSVRRAGSILDSLGSPETCYGRTNSWASDYGICPFVGRANEEYPQQPRQPNPQFSRILPRQRIVFGSDHIDSSTDYTRQDLSFVHFSSSPLSQNCGRLPPHKEAYIFVGRVT